MDSSSSVSVVCPYDDLPCDRVVVGCDFGACYVRRSNGKLISVCPRYIANPNVSVSADFVCKNLLPKGVLRESDGYR